VPAFSHSTAVWQQFPDLVPGVLSMEAVDRNTSVDDAVARHQAVARNRLDGTSESGLPEVQAWRRAFTTMGLKPTQYRCASESLLRRFRKDDDLPRIHPLVDLCNAVSLATAVPIAVFDLDRIGGDLQVRPAAGDERYQTFGGDTEHPEPGEIVFADAEGNAHARRWTNRQSGLSAVGPATSRVIIIAEALHDTASDDMARLLATLADELATTWPAKPVTAQLSAERPAFTW
jgi:DNA/RNA-binding domain of Phe-tRNA-synthetase-like protein